MCRKGTAGKALPGPMGQCAQHPPIGVSRRSMGRIASSFSSSSKKEPVAVSNEMPFRPLVSASTLKACALICPHLLGAENEAGSSGSQSLDSGDMWRYGC